MDGMANKGSAHSKSTKQDGRRHNLRAALELVSHHGSTSRAEIARTTGLTRAAVSSLVGELIDQGMLRELGQGVSPRGGKPPTLLALNERGRDIVAVDLSRQPFSAALLDLTGRIHRRMVAHAADLRGNDGVEAAMKLIGDVIERAEAPVLGIGVGTPGVVDSEGQVLESTNLEWHHLPLGARISNTFDVVASVANDAHLAALAEYRHHPVENRNLMLVKLGRGVGAGLVIGGVLHRGDHFAAGEIGHVQVVNDGEQCRCGNRGCLETVASVPAILRAVGADPNRERWDALVLAAVVGDAPLRNAIRVAGRHLGTVLAHSVALLDVARVVVAPELRNVGDDLVDEIRIALNALILPATADLVEVSVSQLGSDLVLAGAGAAVLHDRLGVVLR